MSKTAKKNFDDKFKAEIWDLFTRVVGQGHSSPDIVKNIGKLLTISEVAILEKRLAAILLLSHGESLRRTSELTGLGKKAVIFVKHGFSGPVPQSNRSWRSPAAQRRDYPRRSRRLHDYSYEAWLRGYKIDRSGKRR